MKTYCGGSTCGGHGDFGTCGKPWYSSEPYQCSMCEAKDLMARLSWKPIETAPKDGTWVILFGGETSHEHYGLEDTGSLNPVVVAKWSGPFRGGEGEQEWVYAFWDGAWYSDYQNPTHWMPLPEPPNGLVES